MAQNAQARYQQLLAQLGQQAGSQPEMALANLDKLLAQRAGDPNLLHIKGLALAQLGRQREAVDAIVDLIQNNFELKGPCIYRGEPYYVPHPEKLPLLLQDHSDRVWYRNIKIREL